MDKVSVIIVTYKNNDMLFRAIDSVLMQTYSNIELIICDDGTPFFDESKISSYFLRKQAQKSFEIIHQACNVGTVRNLNAGIRIATGKWILPLAADDQLFDCNVISSLVSRTLDSDSEWFVSYTQIENNKIFPEKRDAKRLLSGDKKHIYSRLCMHCFIPSSGTMYKKTLLENNGYFDETYKLVEDWPMFLKWVRKGILPQMLPLVSIIKSDGGISNHHADKNKIYQEDLIHVIENEILPFSHEIDEKSRNRVVRNCQDKILIFQFRFTCVTMMQKIDWIVKNMDVVCRKIFNRSGLL